MSEPAKFAPGALAAPVAGFGAISGCAGMSNQQFRFRVSQYMFDYKDIWRFFYVVTQLSLRVQTHDQRRERSSPGG